MSNIFIRSAHVNDLDALLIIEHACFTSDKLSRRSFKHQLQSNHSVFLVAESVGNEPENALLGYVLCLLHKGTKLARLYSLAVLPQARGSGLAQRLLEAGEQAVADNGRLFMRLEVAKSNQAAISLYHRLQYRTFGEYSNYYDDHQDALRMQKNIWHKPQGITHSGAPWYQQTTDFTCGPSALMMAMASLDNTTRCEQRLELELWRESTTIFMTSGLGGTHPFGLALCAKKRGFHASVYVNSDQPLFIDGVRTDVKKNVMCLVHQEFEQQCQEQQLPIHYTDVSQEDVKRWLAKNYAVLMLISTYRLDGNKTPHWVFITGLDEHCLYVHDSDVEEQRQLPIDCQHTPIARHDFEKMSVFGASKLRCAIVLKRNDFALK